MIGAVKVGFRDSEKPDFIEFFVESEPSKLHVADTDPSEFFVSANQDANVTAYIDFVSFFLSHKFALLNFLRG